jgi:hypothetical protein
MKSILQCRTRADLQRSWQKLDAARESDAATFAVRVDAAAALHANALSPRAHLQVYARITRFPRACSRASYPHSVAPRSTGPVALNGAAVLESNSKRRSQNEAGIGWDRSSKRRAETKLKTKLGTRRLERKRRSAHLRSTLRRVEQRRAPRAHDGESTPRAYAPRDASSMLPVAWAPSQRGAAFAAEVAAGTAYAMVATRIHSGERIHLVSLGPMM